MNEPKFDTQQVFNKILEGEKQKILFVNQREYESLRCSLLRKYKNYLVQLDKIASGHRYEEQFLKCSWNSNEVSGAFYLEEKNKRVHAPGARKLYTAIIIPRDL